MERGVAEQVINYAVTVTAEWDPEAGVWVATSDDVPGLVTEHRDFAELERNVLALIPILLVENGVLPEPSGPLDVPVQFVAQAMSKGFARIAA